MSRQTILVVDDEQDLLDLLEYNLQKEGFHVIKADDGEEGIELARKHQPNLILLDIMMPNMDGMEVCRQLREDPQSREVPIIFLTARGDEKTEVEGLNLGADDFVTKPISTRKLMSRIHAVLRRVESPEEEEKVIRVHDLEVDRDRYLVRRGEEEFQLPRKEFELLWYLASHNGRVQTREKLLNEIWGDNIYVVDRTVDVHVRKIREKLGDHYIETVKGVGYRFKE